jgi:hypothetical protein
MKDPKIFQAVIPLVQNNVTTYGHTLTGCLTIMVIYQNRIFAQKGFGLISDTRLTLVTTYWKRRFVILASLPSLGNIGLVTNQACSIVYTQLLLGYRHCCCYYLLKKTLLYNVTVSMRTAKS